MTTEIEHELANTRALSAPERQLLEHTSASNHRTTLVEELLRDEEAERYQHMPVLELTHLEPTELARHITETCKGDPRHDFASALTNGMDDMPFAERPKVNKLVCKLLLGEITVEEQCTLNDIIVKGMLAHGLHQVQYALKRAQGGR